MKDQELQNRFSYEFKDWKKTIGFEPVELLASQDISGSYEMNAGHVFKLNDGKYATVYESGCSCYSPDWASIDILPDLESVRNSLKNSGNDVDKLLLAELMGK